MKELRAGLKGRLKRRFKRGLKGKGLKEGLTGKLQGRFKEGRASRGTLTVVWGPLSFTRRKLEGEALKAGA